MHVIPLPQLYLYLSIRSPGAPLNMVEPGMSEYLDT